MFRGKVTLTHVSVLLNNDIHEKLVNELSNAYTVNTAVQLPR